MGHYVGLDVGKGSHWACVLDEQDEVILSRRLEATDEALEAFCSEIAQLGVTARCPSRYASIRCDYVVAVVGDASDRPDPSIRRPEGALRE